MLHVARIEWNEHPPVLAGGPDADPRHARPVVCHPLRCQAKNPGALSASNLRSSLCLSRVGVQHLFEAKGSNSETGLAIDVVSSTGVERDWNGDLAYHFGQVRPRIDRRRRR